MAPNTTVRKKGRAKSTAPTSAEVATIAGVSRSTVSRTFTQGASVDPVTRARIIEVAQDIGYAPNQAARSLISGRSDTVGLVMASFDNPFYHTVLSGFLDHFQRRDIRVMCHAAPDIDGVDEGVRAMLRYNVDAMIIAASGMTSSVIDDCRRSGVSTVLFNRTIPGSRVHSVQTDNLAGGRTMADFLAIGGHGRMAYIHGLEQSSTNRDRYTGFADRVAELGLPEPQQEFGEYTYQGGREAVKRLMMSGNAPDAVFCANDIMAFGVLDGLRTDLGLSVPGDVSVTGFDDVPMASWPSFGLTTIRQRRNRMIDAAVALLDTAITDPKGKDECVSIEGRLILRESARLPSPRPS